MKSIRSILFLSVIVMSIIMFWLAPGINSAKNTEYVRRYENTDQHANSIADTTINKHLRRKQQKESAKLLPETKVYKEERIRSTDKVSRIKPSMFSRAAQFEEIEKLYLDSITHLVDTSKITQ